VQFLHPEAPDRRPTRLVSYVAILDTDMEQHPLDPDEARQRLGLPPVHMSNVDTPPPPKKAYSPPGFAGIIFRSVLVFTIIGPAWPLPLTMLLDGHSDLFFKMFLAYPLALFFGGMVAAFVGFVFGLSFALLNRFIPKLLKVRSWAATFAKSLGFTAAFCLAYSTHLFVGHNEPWPADELRGAISLFLGPTFICGTIVSLWLLRKLSRAGLEEA
jgi:hypothetical protein